MSIHQPSLIQNNLRTIVEIMRSRKRTCSRRLAAARKMTDAWARKVELALNEAEKRYVSETLSVAESLLAESGCVA